MVLDEMMSAAEAILFACGEAIETERIAQALEIDCTMAEKVLKSLSDILDERGSGLCVLKLGNMHQLCTRTQYADLIREILETKKNTPLSPAAFEVLAVVAYNQPVTKAFIEQVRGVDCSGVLTTLSLRGLVQEMGRLDLPGRPLIYGTTPEFLRCFCLTSLADLPELPDREKGEDSGDIQLTFSSLAADEHDSNPEERNI